MGGEKETTLERIARLKREIEEVSLEVSSSVVGSEGDGVGVGGVDDARGIVEGMKRKLGGVAGLYGEMGILKLREDIGRDVEVARGEKRKGKGKGEGEGEEGTVVYELFVGSSGGGEVTEEDAVLAALEKRVGNLEGMLTTNGMGRGGRPIAERIGEAEEKIKRLDEKSLAASAATAKIMRADLEAAHKLKKASSNVGMSSPDAAMVQKLHSQFVQLESVQDSLPILVERLLDLNSLHSDAATFADRLEGAEVAVMEANFVLKSCETSLGAVEKGMGGMLKQVMENVKVMEESIKGKK